jgi:hypothetical protein
MPELSSSEEIVRMYILQCFDVPVDCHFSRTWLGCPRTVVRGTLRGLPLAVGHDPGG